MLHASPRHGAPPTSDLGTGEIRVPLALYDLDEHQADVSLVLSRTEAGLLHASLDRLLSGRRLTAGGVQ
ncbi:hypothetical protein RM572_26915 [Streptomyces sp. DSM 42041]|uniref:Uncharacterized protein n=1 Tax=Streptomyces hazeniae TaxID=3075538 RepID=A0ABU2NZI0_9ACTN|nr:hypothetical protein [Streptomyces sp. DSM 42041]MDT0382396.1 hypothetical protein [Streptomyces sp. DSM 42041]